jgi:hypothetical protein
MSTALAPGSRRAASLLGALALALLVLALPATASADGQSCSGKLKRIAKTADRDTGVDYQLRCAEPITAFALVSSIELVGFDVSADVFDPASAGGNIRGDDRLGNCSGELPSSGFTCAGTYSAQNRLIKSSFDTMANPCARSKGGDLKLWASVVVLNESGSLSGPFPLSKVRGCPAKKKHHGKNHH